MNFYERHILPPVLDLVMRRRIMSKQRAKLLPAAEGTVLEVGIGSAPNLPFYTDAVTRLFGLEPSEALRRKAERNSSNARFPVEFVGLYGEEIPLDSGTMDTVVTTWTLCTIPDAAQALREMRRVLKPGGRLLFVEHGRAPEEVVARWQDRLNPVWRPLAGGCNMNRPIEPMVRGAGFRINRLDASYIPGPRVLSYQYMGQARPD